MPIVNRIEEMLKSYDVDYEKEYFEEDNSYEFWFEIGKKGMILAQDKEPNNNEPNNYDFFMGGFENEMGVKSDLSQYRSIEDALLHMSIIIKNKIKETHYKGIQ